MPHTQVDIIFVVPYRFVPPANGGQQAAYGFASFLSRMAALACISTPQQEEAEFPTYSLLPSAVYKYFSPLAAFKIWRQLRRSGARACIAHQSFIAVLLWPVCRLAGVPLVIYVQNIEYQRFRSMGKWWWPAVYIVERWANRRADHLFFISPDDLPEARRAFSLPAGRCTPLPYGVWQQSPPADRAQARAAVCQRHGFSPAEKLLIFFGPQSYAPNLAAVKHIIQDIHPRLQAAAGFPYRILICGGGLPAEYEHFKHLQGEGITYLGFVPHIEEYVKAADLMLNPVNTGGGVKTKLLEAIGWGTPVVSSRTGAKGVEAAHCGAQLSVVPDDDYEAHVRAILSHLAKPVEATPATFYGAYYWGEVVKGVLEVLGRGGTY